MSHKRIVLSSLPEASTLPSGLNAISSTQLVCPVSGDAPSGRCVATSHKRIVLSMLLEASTLPSGLNATRFSQSVCPVKGSPSRSRFATFHRMVLYPLPEASTLPSGLNVTLLCTLPVCPVQSVPSASRFTTSHSLTYSSVLPEANVLLIGTKCHTPNPALVAAEQCAQWLPWGSILQERRYVPQEDGLIIAARSEHSTIRAERHACYHICVPGQHCTSWWPCRHIP